MDSEAMQYRYPDALLKEKYKIFNYALIVICAIFIVFRIALYTLLYPLMITSGFSGEWFKAVGWLALLLNTVMLVLMVWIIKLLFRFDARAYLLLIILSLTSLSSMIKYFDMLSTVLVLAGLGLSFFLKKKLFPNIPVFSYVPKK